MAKLANVVTDRGILANIANLYPRSIVSRQMGTYHPSKMRLYQTFKLESKDAQN